MYNENPTKHVLNTDFKDTTSYVSPAKLQTNNLHCQFLYQ